MVVVVQGFFVNYKIIDELDITLNISGNIISNDEKQKGAKDRALRDTGCDGHRFRLDIVI